MTGEGFPDGGGKSRKRREVLKEAVASAVSAVLPSWLLGGRGFTRVQGRLGSPPGVSASLLRTTLIGWGSSYGVPGSPSRLIQHARPNAPVPGRRTCPAPARTDVGNRGERITAVPTGVRAVGTG